MSRLVFFLECGELVAGCLKEMKADLGGHGAENVFVNNVGGPMQ